MKLKAFRSILVMAIALLSIGAGAVHFMNLEDVPSEELYEFAPPPEEVDQYTSGETNYTPALKAETVYVKLDHQGSVKDKVIVNRIHGGKDQSAPMVADYGNYLAIENMVSDGLPVIEDNRLLWNSSLLVDEALYYEGSLDKNLPLTITIEYSLDGEEILAERLAGESGHLEITVRAKNNLRYEGPVSYYDYHGNLVTVDDLNYVPFLVQGSLDLDLETYSDIESGDGTEIIIGSTASVNFIIFPYPEDEITISMNGNNIELEAISFVIEPRLLMRPEVDVEEDLLKLLNGLRQLTEGLEALTSGSDQLLRGMRLFQQESGRYAAGTEELSVYLDNYRVLRNRLMPVISNPNQQEVLRSLDELGELLEMMENIPHPDLLGDELAAVENRIADLERQIERVNNRISVIQDRSPRVRDEAQKLVSENEPGSDLYLLGQLLLERENELENLSSENRLFNQNLDELRSAVNTLNNNWENGFVPGLQALEMLNTYLGSGRITISDQIARFSRIISDNLQYLEDLDRIILEAEQLLRDGAALPGVINELASGQEQLNAGLKELKDSGFLILEKGLIEGINESRYAKAKLDLMEQLADDYRSFADNENNRYSEVQFIMQTAELKITADSQTLEDEPVTELEQSWALKLWIRLINLFSN